MATTETIAQEIVSPYIGRRISGTSGDVVEVLLTVEYRFDDCTIRVFGIPARYDQETGREYVAARDGAAIMRAVNALVGTSRERHGSGRGEPLELHAPDILRVA